MTDIPKQLKILLVDDDHFLLDMYSLKFQKASTPIETSSSTLNALEKLRAGNLYDIILLDIIMPGMDGLDLLKTIRNEKLSPTSTIIMLTNQADNVDKAEALGIDGYIIKATMIPSEIVEEVNKIHNNKSKK